MLFFLVDISRVARIQTNEAHHYRRALLMRKVLTDLGLKVGGPHWPLHPLYSQLSEAWLAGQESSGVARPEDQPRTLGADPQDSIFIGQLGDVFPSAFLPICVGNVLDAPLTHIYRQSPLLRALRNPARLQGHCGACEFRGICGGSRSRAFSTYANPLGPDPACCYDPGSFPFQEQLRPYLALSQLR